MAFSATARIPCRPLSYGSASTMAEPKELIVDYEHHRLYLCDVNGDIVDITNSVDVDSIDIDELWAKLLALIDARIDEKITEIDFGDGDITEIVKNVIITLKTGDQITINSSIVEMYQSITDIKQMIEDGTVIDTIPAEKVIESVERQFVNEDDKKIWNNASDLIENVNSSLTDIGGIVDIFMLNCTIASGDNAWTATDSSEPYTQNVTLADVKETDIPIVDIVLSEDYNTAMEELNNYAYIYKITTHDGYIKVYSSQATTTAINIQMKIDRKEPLPEITTD